MKPIQAYHLIKPEDPHWRPSNLMQIPNADFLERTGSGNLSTRLRQLGDGVRSCRRYEVEDLVTSLCREACVSVSGLAQLQGSEDGRWYELLPQGTS